MYKILDVVLFVILIQFSHGGLLGYLLVRELLDVFMRYWRQGVITLVGLKYTSGDNEISFNDINNIVGGYDRSILLSNTVVVKIETSNSIEEICIYDKEIAKLAKTHLNQFNISTKWDFDKNLISITPGKFDEYHVSYDAVGKYSLPPYMPNLLGFILFAVAIGGLFLNLFNISAFFTIFAIFTVVCFIPPYYKQVLVQLNNKGILFKNEGIESFLAFREIAKIEKKIFQTKITMKNRNVIYFPKACYLLPEFIMEMTKP